MVHTVTHTGRHTTMVHPVYTHTNGKKEAKRGSQDPQNGRKEAKRGSQDPSGPLKETKRGSQDSVYASQDP